MDSLTDYLALANDVLQAVIVIFGSAVVLYNIGGRLRNQVIRAFCALISFVVIVYLTELLVSRAIIAETWLRRGWVGIALVPAALYQLSDALLSTTGASPVRRRWLVPLGYLTGLVFLGLVFFSDWIVGDIVESPHSINFEAGPLFFVFVIYYWVGTLASLLNVWRARKRSVTTTARQRMTTTMLVLWAAPVSVFPYLILSNRPGQQIPVILWLALILGNLTVGLMFGILTAHLAYFGASSPDRLVRVRLFKFMARVPLAATILLLVYVLVSRSSVVFGLNSETALGFAMVATLMLVEWAIHAYKRPLERLFHLNDEPDVRRIQELSERLLTTKDLHQFLETILATACEAIRTPTAFVAAITAGEPRLEAVIGPLVVPEAALQAADWRQLAQAAEPNGRESHSLESVDNYFVWQNYWIRPLYDQQHNDVLGIIGVQARAPKPDFTEEEQQLFDRLIRQAEMALEDRILQQGVFAAVEGLLPQITALQQRRSAAALGGILDAPEDLDVLLTDPDFNTMVRDALTHYWGGPKLTKSPLMRLKIVQDAMEANDNNPVNALRTILARAIERQKPAGERNMTAAEWILYNILELKFIQGRKVREVARRLAMSESDLYRKQRVAIENVARTVAQMEQETADSASTDPALTIELRD